MGENESPHSPHASKNGNWYIVQRIATDLMAGLFSSECVPFLRGDLEVHTSMWLYQKWPELAKFLVILK
jgi:hypothetical protein